jgi:hypothetical protein
MFRAWRLTLVNESRNGKSVVVDPRTFGECHFGRYTDVHEIDGARSSLDRDVCRGFYACGIEFGKLLDVPKNIAEILHHRFYLVVF